MNKLFFIAIICIISNSCTKIYHTDRLTNNYLISKGDIGRIVVQNITYDLPIDVKITTLKGYYYDAKIIKYMHDTYVLDVNGKRRFVKAKKISNITPVKIEDKQSLNQFSKVFYSEERITQEFDVYSVVHFRFITLWPLITYNQWITNSVRYHIAACENINGDAIIMDASFLTSRVIRFKKTNDISPKSESSIIVPTVEVVTKSTEHKNENNKIDIDAKDDLLVSDSTLIKEKVLDVDMEKWQSTTGNQIEMGQVLVGNQIWMSENLNTETFRNGDLILHAHSIDEWKRAGKKGIPAWCYYDNKAVYGESYGKLYNWHAVSDPRGLAPEGWHVPSDEEWDVLSEYLGDNPDIVGRKLKAQNGWAANGNGTNESGLSFLPGGSRSHIGEYDFIGIVCRLWSSSKNLDLPAYRFILSDNDNFFKYFNGDKSFGMSVRCVRD